MTDLLQDIILDNIIVHQIFQRSPDEENVKKPIFSSNFEELDDDGKKALEYRLNGVLNKESKRMNLVINNDTPESTFQKMAYLATYKYDNTRDPKDPEFWNSYIETTKQLAWDLQEVQKSSNIPSGLLIIITGQTGPEMNNFAAVIKAEMEDGFEFTGDKLHYISNLLLTETQKLYKVGIFIDVNPQGRNKESKFRDKADFKGFVFDDNTSKSAEKNNVAVYFYSSFLGCSLEDSSRATKRFLEGAKSIVAGLPIPQEKKVEKVNQVYAYLTSNTEEINAKVFVETYVEPELQVEFLDKLEKNKVPLHSVPKDITPIKKKLKSRTLSFSSGVQLKFSFEETQEPVEIVESTDEHTIVKIRGKINKQ